MQILNIKRIVLVNIKVYIHTQCKYTDSYMGIFCVCVCVLSGRQHTGSIGSVPVHHAVSMPKVDNIDDMCEPYGRHINVCVPYIQHKFTVRCHNNLKQGRQWVYLALVVLDVLFTEVANTVLYCYSIWMQKYVELANEIQTFTFKASLLHFMINTSLQITSHNIVILDDLLPDFYKSNWCDKLFTAFSQHLKITIIFVSQNLFLPSEIICNITLSQAYVVLFRSSRDCVQIRVLGSQLSERQTLFSACDDATFESFGSLVIDFTSRCHKLLNIMHMCS